MKNNMKEDMYSQHHAQVRRLIVVLLLMLAVCMLFLAYREKTRKQPVSQMQKPHNMTQETGRMWLSLPHNRHVYEFGENVEFTLSADTQTKRVVGYDAVVKVPSSMAKLVSYEVLKSDFEVKVVQSADAIHISGFSREQELPAEGVVVAKEPLVAVVLKPFVTTSIPLKLSFSPQDTSDSNLITSSIHDILAHVEGDDVYFGESTTLAVGKTIELAPRVSMTLQKIVEPDASCADCLTEAHVVMSVQGVSTSHVFAFGGIMGSVQSGFETEVGIFEATMTSSSQLRVRYVLHDK